MSSKTHKVYVTLRLDGDYNEDITGIFTSYYRARKAKQAGYIDNKDRIATWEVNPETPFYDEIENGHRAYIGDMDQATNKLTIKEESKRDTYIEYNDCKANKDSWNIIFRNFTNYNHISIQVIALNRTEAESKIRDKLSWVMQNPFNFYARQEYGDVFGSDNYKEYYEKNQQENKK